MMKKFWLVSQLVDLYEYFIVCDAEVEVVKHVNIYETAKQIFGLKKVFGTRVSPGPSFDIIHDSMLRFQDDEKSRLMNVTKNGTLYTWFNEIPIMDSSSARSFLADTSLGILNASQIISFNEFDILVYHYYMSLNYNWSFVDALPENSTPRPTWFSLAECGGGDGRSLKKIQPHWAAKMSWENNPRKFDSYDVFLTFHGDFDSRTLVSVQDNENLISATLEQACSVLHEGASVSW